MTCTNKTQPEIIDVTLGSIDRPEAFTPTFNIFEDNKLPFVMTQAPKKSSLLSLGASTGRRPVAGNFEAFLATFKNRLPLFYEGFCRFLVFFYLATINVINGLQVKTFIKTLGHITIEIFFHIAVSNGWTRRKTLRDFNGSLKKRFRVADLLR